jgi:hypothetical protein
MKTSGSISVASPFLTSAVDGGKKPVSRPSRKQGKEAG